LASKLFRAMAQKIPFNGLRSLLLRLGGTRIGRGTYIGRCVEIGPNVEIGKDCTIHPWTTLHDCRIGDRTKVERHCVIVHCEIGDDCDIDRGSVFRGAPKNRLRVGNEVIVGINWLLDGTGGIVVEDYVNLGSHLGGIFSHSGVRQRLMGCPSNERKYLERSPVRIGTCSWLGGKVTIQPGVTIGDHAVVLPNSSVTKDVEPYTMVSGVPAKPIKRVRIKDEQVEFLPYDA